MPTASPPPPESPPASPPPPVPPTAMDNLLAVAELELELQSGALPPAQYPYRADEQVARDAIAFDLGEPKEAGEMFFDRSTHAPERVEDAFPGDMHKELFESISEAHYLPELGEPHDEALLESLVEKGCEDNQILGQALASLVSGAGEYGEEEDDMLLGGAPVADIIDRLESLESPGRSSMTAAQGLLHLHRVGDQLPSRERKPSDYMADEAFAPRGGADCHLETLAPAPQPQEAAEVNRLEYEQSAEKRLQPEGEPADELFTEQVPDLNETYEENVFGSNSQTAHVTSERTEVSLLEPLSLPLHNSDNNVSIPASNDEIGQESDVIEGDEGTRDEADEDRKPVVEVLAKVNENPEAPKDLSIMYIEDDGEPRDLTVRRRTVTPQPSPRRTEIPRAPSRESDAMQSPQPSGIPAMSSPEVFQAPPSKNKTQSILDAMFTSSSPRMYLTSEVSITKQQCEPLNLGKHRKSASPTVSSCSEEKSNKSIGEPLEKRAKRNSMDDLYQITRILTEKKKKENKPVKKNETKDWNTVSALNQFRSLKANKNFNIPDPLLIPKERFMDIKRAPGKEIPALLVERPELRYYDDLDEERDRDIIVIAVQEFEALLIGQDLVEQGLSKPMRISENERVTDTPITPTIPEPAAPKPSGQPRPAPSMGALAEDIDAANSATIGPMLWARYAQHQMEAMAACSQNVDFMKAVSASGYSNYADLTQMLMNPPPRLMNTPGIPVLSQLEYDRLNMFIWQEMMLQQKSQTRRKSSSVDAQHKEAAAKTSEFQSPYVHSTNKGYHGRPHTSARTSPITNSYSNQRPVMAQHPFLQNMYPPIGTGRASTQSLPMGGLTVPYYNAGALGNQRSPRVQHKSPTPPAPSTYYANNNYLQSMKASEAAAAAQRAALSPAEGVRPRISVKKVDDLLRRRDDTEVGSTTPLGEVQQAPDSSGLWHPFFSNQKNCSPQCQWTTVTATGD